MLAEIEAGVPLRDRRQLTKALMQVIDLLKEHNDTERILHLSWEASLCMQGTATQIVHASEKRFFTIWETLPEAMDYYAVRAKQVVNSVLKAHYSDFVYEQGSAFDKHVYAMQAIDAYIESARQFAVSDDADLLDDMVDALDRATFLSIHLNKRHELILVVEILGEVIERQSRITLKWGGTEIPKGRWAFEPIQILRYIKKKSKFADLVNDTLLIRAQRIADELAEAHCAAENHLWEQNFLELARDIALLRNDKEAGFEFGLRYGEAKEHEAEVRASMNISGAHLAAASIYEQAQRYYVELRDNPNTPPENRVQANNCAESVKVKIRAMYRVGRDEMFVIASPVEIDVDVLEGMVQHLLAPDTLHECLIHIASEGALLPNVNKAEEWALKMQEKWIWQSRMPQTMITDDMSVLQASSKEELLKFEKDKTLVMWVDLNSHTILPEVFNRLREQKGLNAESLSNYFDQWGMLDEDNRQIIGVGFERYFAGDFVSLLHILVPQFEDVLRTLFEKAGVATIRQRDGVKGWQFETFGSFLDSDVVKKTLPLELREYIRIVMTEQAGWNLRNRVAHGLIHPELCTKSTADTVLHLFLMLTLFRITNDARDAGGAA